jgi:chemotaxis protein MotB
LSSGENLPVQEIVIIRRSGGGDDEGHHGGMWKIAFADFMTAMMAFFLVMWLINATDETKLQQIATYFNPIKLPDQQKSERALQTADSHGGENQQATNERNAPKGEQHAGKGESESKESGGKGEEALFTDPYGILSKIATQVVKIPLQQGSRDEAAPQFSGGPAFRDPFDPDFRKRTAEGDLPLQPSRPGARDGAGDDEGTMPTELGVGPGEDAPGRTPGQQQAAQQSGQQPSGQQQAGTQPSGQQAPGPGGQGPQQQAANQQPATPPSADAAKQRQQEAARSGAAGTPGDVASQQAPARQLEAEIKKVLSNANLRDVPEINVQRTSEGILISLTDKMDFEMFGVSSAQPKPEMVVAMERIGKLLQGRGEKIVVRGHTDARPFRSGTYDNWRLSSDRANIAHYMLVRGGLPEQRFERIEGYAATALKLPGDPNAAANRRIEILLRTPST